MEILNNNNNFIDLVQNLDGKIDYEAFYKELISNLNLKGDKLIGSCPFPDHPDKHPSFNLNLTNGQYYCFGCSRKGNAISLLTELHNLSSEDAL